MEKLAWACVLAEPATRAVLMNLAGAGGVGPPGEGGVMQALPWQSCSPSGSPGVGCVWTQFSSPSSLHSHSHGQGSSSKSGSLEEEERELELLLEEELELEELEELDEDQEELLDEEELLEELELLLDDELEEDDELELLEEELEDGALLEEVGVSGTKELLWKLEDDQLLEEDEEELELLDRDELEEESGSSGTQELCWELEDELLEEEELELLEEELELLLDLGSNSKESPPPAEELLDEFPSSSSWYRLTSVSTVSPSLPGGMVSSER